MRVVVLGVSMGLMFPRSPTMSSTLEFTPQFPVLVGTGTVPLRSVPRFLPREDVIGIFYRTEPLISYPLWKV